MLIFILLVKNKFENHRFASMAHETEHDFWLK
ncbi:unnamed protein product, partial [Rotaria socialis]